MMTNQKMFIVCTKLLGIRDAKGGKEGKEGKEGKDDFKGKAAYAMDNGIESASAAIYQNLNEWQMTLRYTIRYIMSLSSFNKDRYLVLATGVLTTEHSERYPSLASVDIPKHSTFAKKNFPTNAEYIASVKFGNQSEDDLVNWVINNI